MHTYNTSEKPTFESLTADLARVAEQVGPDNLRRAMAHVRGVHAKEDHPRKRAELGLWLKAAQAVLDA